MVTDTNSPGIERPSYFHGQMLTARDFADEQDYFRQKLRRHNRLLHGWGVVCGLRVTPAKDGCAVMVSPGYALDPCGDEILVEEEAPLSLPSQGCETADEVSRRRTETAICPDGVWYVAVRHAEVPTQVVPVLGESGETDGMEPSRVRETYELRVLATSPALPPGLVAGRLGRRGEPAIDCPSCPPDPEERWVVLAEVRVREGRITVHDLKPS
jgi:hypothetical protein